MSTELKSRTEDVMLTRYYGGEDRGTCVQVTQQKTLIKDYFRHINLTREEARTVAQDLMKFAEGKEEELI